MTGATPERARHALEQLRAAADEVEQRIIETVENARLAEIELRKVVEGSPGKNRRKRVARASKAYIAATLELSRFAHALEAARERMPVHASADDRLLDLIREPERRAA